MKKFLVGCLLSIGLLANPLSAFATPFTPATVGGFTDSSTESANRVVESQRAEQRAKATEARLEALEKQKTEAQAVLDDATSSEDEQKKAQKELDEANDLINQFQQQVDQVKAAGAAAAALGALSGNPAAALAGAAQATLAEEIVKSSPDSGIIQQLRGTKSAGYSKTLADATSNFSLEKFTISDRQHKMELFKPQEKENSFLDVMIEFIAFTIGTFAIFAMSVGAYFLVTANGDQNQITKGKSIFTYAIIGVVITFLSYTIIAFAISLVITQ